METLQKFGRITAVVMVIIGMFMSLAPATLLAEGGRARIAPINTKPGGQSYGRWAAEWWQWALGVPGPVNPLSDTTGENCGQRQIDDVWFLAGTSSFNPIPMPVIRTCTVPAGKALFFPLINNAFFAFLTDLPEQRTEEFLRENAKCEFPVELFVEIDGVEVRRRLTRFFTGESGSRSQSPLFNVQLTPDNFFGLGPEVIPELVLSPSAEEGYYLFIQPLRPGEHTLHWQATGCSDPMNIQDITYNLTIMDNE